MYPALLGVVIAQTGAGFTFDVQPSQGLTIAASGVPVVKGSTIQYYEKGWLKAYYSTNGAGQKVERVDADTLRMTFTGYNGLATGTVTYHREGDLLKVHYDLHWGGPDSAEIELTDGLISARALQQGTLTWDGKPARNLKQHEYSGGGDFESRRFGPDGLDANFESLLTKLEAKTEIPATLFDARGYAQDYAEGKSLWWFGHLDLPISKDKPVVFDTSWKVDPQPVAAASSVKEAWTSTPTPTAIVPDETPPMVIPTPATNQLNFNKTLEFTGAYSWPAGRVRFWAADFVGTLARRYELPPVSSKAVPIKFDGGVSKLGLHPGGFQITITPDSISVLGEEDDGLHNGLRRLAQLAFVRNGRIVFPTGYLKESPKIVWRGAHMFVGPDALGFQQKLWDRVLLPLGFNKAVLQCERTQWDCLPSMKNAKDTTTKADLAKLFAYYRSIGVEPIPLIQSFGHMEWFFQDGQNLDVAFNPKEPYGVDPRNPKSKELLENLWSEACDLLKPTTIHFGCDEVDMVGFPTDHAALMTDLWTAQMPILGAIAAKHNAKMMIWGDEALAPTEAIDATNGESKEQAAKRRAAIPKGTLIADWHYKSDIKAEDFLPSLQLWKKEGFVPVASTWYQPDDIRSFDLAADVEHTGTLQTTWPGYSIDEKTMEENFEQFSAMVLASEYSWSSRFDAVAKLGYDPATVFRKLYYGTPRPFAPQTGEVSFKGDSSTELVDQDMHFKLGSPISLRSLISAPGAPTTADVQMVGEGSHLCLALDTIETGDIGEPVADIAIEFSDGKILTRRLRYGIDVRAGDDTAASARADTVNGKSIVEISLGRKAQVKGIRLDALSPSAGLRLFGSNVW